MLNRLHNGPVSPISNRSAEHHIEMEHLKAIVFDNYFIDSVTWSHDLGYALMHLLHLPVSTALYIERACLDNLKHFKSKSYEN